jgi:Phage integrase, N-terminal SAM-like domain
MSNINKNMLRERAKPLPEVTEEMWQQVNEDYRLLVEEYVSVQNHSPETKKQYMSGLKQFGWYLKSSMNNKPFYKVTKRDFIRFMSYLRDNRKQSSSAQSFKKACVSSLCNFTLRMLLLKMMITIKCLGTLLVDFLQSRRTKFMRKLKLPMMNTWK